MYELKTINVRLRFCFISHLLLKVVMCCAPWGGGGGVRVVSSLTGVILVSLRGIQDSLMAAREEMS